MRICQLLLVLSSLLLTTTVLANTFWRVGSYSMSDPSDSGVAANDLLEIEVFDRAGRNPELAMIGELCDFNQEIVQATTGTYRYFYCSYRGSVRKTKTSNS